MKLKRIISIVSCIAILSCVVWGCERDDICAETTRTTPRLIIDFYDINDQDELKSVRQLLVRGIADDGTLGPEIPADRLSPSTIVLPLRFQEEGVETSSRFHLERDRDFLDNDNPNNTSNIDIIDIKYTPEFIYVSRACGYKSIFNFGTTGGITRETDTNNWIDNFEILNLTIDNENETHLIIYH